MLTVKQWNWWKEFCWGWSWSESPPFSTGTNTERTVQSSLDRKLASMKSSDMAWAGVWKLKLLHNFCITLHVLFYSLATLWLRSITAMMLNTVVLGPLCSWGMYNLLMECFKGQRFPPYQDTAVVTVPVKSSQVFSSWLNKVGCTARDTLTLTIGRDLNGAKARNE